MTTVATQPTRSMWLWDAVDAPARIAAFARAERVGEVFVSVPWGGPTAAIRALSRELRGQGLRVACLGSGSDWADIPARAAEWAGRALADGGFDAVHLDIEPWAAEDWPAHAQRRLRGLAEAVGAVRSATALQIDVDVPAPHVAEYPEAFAGIMRVASAVTIMAYRDRTAAILSLSEPARAIAASVGRPYRIGIDTRPSTEPHSTFADDGRRALEREIAPVGVALQSDPHWSGIAVHDYAGWRALRP